MSTEYTVGQIIDVRVEKIVPRGFGIAFAERVTILIPLAVVGDELRVEIREIKKRLAFAEIVEITSPGPDRIVPPCVYVGTCGGCDFQQMTYAAQLAAKVGIIRDCLQRIGKISYEIEIPIISSPAEFGYRSRVRWQIDHRSRAFGYFRRDSHEVIDVNACPILSPALESTLRSFRDGMDWNGDIAERGQLEAAADDQGSISKNSHGSHKPPAEITVNVSGEQYSFSARSFFQANQLLIPGLIETAIGEIGGIMAFDLYCGVGLFSLPLGRRFEHVIGVEGDPEAVEFAKRNVARAGLENVKISGKSVDHFLRENKTRDVDFLLLDPPRSGTGKNTIRAIGELAPRQISYVSCEPSILARDLRTLLDAGYSIESITAIDLFPQTHHVETVARLKMIR